MSDRELFHTVMGMLRGDKYGTANELVHAIIETVDAARAQQGEGREAVGVVDFSGVVQWFKPYTSPPAGTELYTNPAKDQGVPEGWKFERESGDRITIDADGLGFYVARMDAERIADIMLYALAQDLLPSEPDMGGEK